MDAGHGTSVDRQTHSYSTSSCSYHTTTSSMAGGGGGGHHHRATLKQKNKSFKSRHSTKSSIKKLAKGRPADSASASSKGSSVAASARNAQTRKNHAKQMQLAKREQLKQVQELYKNGMDKVVSVLELTPDGNAWDVCRALEQHKGVEGIDGCDVASAIAQAKESSRIR